MSHYDTLGVPREASAEDIKAAYRALASKHHPDRHPVGTADGLEAQVKMAEINRAYDTLGDPERRAHYDASGKDMPAVDPVTQAATSIIIQHLKASLGNSDDMLAFARGRVKMSLENAIGNVKQAEQNIRFLEKKARKIRFKGEGTNLVAAVVESEIAGMRETIAQMERAQVNMKRALELLGEYEQEGEDAPRRQRFDMLLGAGPLYLGGV